MGKKKSKTSSLNRRKDNRTVKEFADDIKTYTQIEAFVIEKWQQEMIRHGSKVSFEDEGVDNTGELIKGFVGVGADFKVTMDNAKPILVDVKHNYNDGTATFKRHNLDAYIKRGIHMLVFLGTGLNARKIEVSQYEEEWKNSFHKRTWALVTPNDMKKIIKKVPCTKIKFMGGKPGHIIYQRQFGEYLKLNTFKYV